MLIEIKQPDFRFGDERGLLVQLVHEGYSQINVIETSKNSYRGGHYHKLNSEAFYIITGEIMLVVEKDGVSEKYHFTAGEMFEIPPLVSHSFFFTQDTILVSMYSTGVELENGKKDIYKLDRKGVGHI